MFSWHHLFHFVMFSKELRGIAIRWHICWLIEGFRNLYMFLEAFLKESCVFMRDKLGD
jgi:hypothetical protein